MIRLDSVTKIYNKGKPNEFTALSDVSITVNARSLACIKGASGAGKSTLLHIIGALDKPSEGRYFFEDEDVSEFSGKCLARFRNERIGFVLQNFSLIDDETVAENIQVPLLFSRSDDGAYERIEELTERLKIGKLLKRRVKNLSGGEKQRVAIARALVNNPQLILADEPTGALDTANAAAVLEILTDLNRQGKTVIIITHDQSIADMCGNVITLSDGRVTEDRVSRL
jgi:putative ABC transport system ATP-binding protein